MYFGIKFFEIRLFGDAMKSEILKDITSYINFLREYGFSVTVSCFDKVLEIHLPTLLKYEVHLPAICSYLKANPLTQGKCPENKRKLEKKEPNEPYYSCCYAGVEEFVVPIIDDNSILCCVNVSGYKGGMKESDYLAKKYEKRLGKHFSSLYLQLNDKIPSKEEVLRAIKPLEYMFKGLKKECLQSADELSVSSHIYRQALKYIYDNYMNDFTLSDMAKALNYSPSYLRHKFTEQSGKTIIQTLNSVRLSQSTVLLKTTNLSVTRIAAECGFCDGNYFSTVFKKKYGISPKEYRKSFE